MSTITRRIEVRAIDLDRLGIDLMFVSPHDPGVVAKCKDNARLIAASIDLLEACQLLVADYEDENSAIGYDWYRKAKAAIAKATREQS